MLANSKQLNFAISTNFLSCFQIVQAVPDSAIIVAASASLSISGVIMNMYTVKLFCGFQYLKEDQRKVAVLRIKQKICAF